MLGGRIAHHLLDQPSTRVRLLVANRGRRDAARLPLRREKMVDRHHRLCRDRGNFGTCSDGCGRGISQRRHPRPHLRDFVFGELLLWRHVRIGTRHESRDQRALVRLPRYHHRAVFVPLQHRFHGVEFQPALSFQRSVALHAMPVEQRLHAARPERRRVISREKRRSGEEAGQEKEEAWHGRQWDEPGSRPDLKRNPPPLARSLRLRRRPALHSFPQK